MRQTAKMKLFKYRLVRLLFTLLLVWCLSFTAAGQTIETHHSGNVSISIRGADIAEVFEMLSREWKINILLGDGVEGKVSINLYNVSLRKAIHLIAVASGYAVERMDDTFFIRSEEEVGKYIAGGMTELKTYKVQYTDPDQIAGILTKHLSRYGKITPLPQRSMLVIEDLPSFLERIEELLKEIDREPKQILIEAQILEITLDESETYGIDWSRLFKSNLTGSTDGKGTFGTQGLSSPGSPGFFFSYVNPNIQMALTALARSGKVRALATPKLLALENQMARVVIGDRLGFRVTTTINAVTTESVNFIESGIILNVTPNVDHSGRIMLKVHPEVSSGTVTAGIPSINTTEVTTQLLANDGQTVFIGGLLRSTSSRSQMGVKGLSRIPLLGRMFRNSELTSVNTETVVLITPRIVEPGTDPFMAKMKVKVNAIYNDFTQIRMNIERTIHNQRKQPAATANGDLGADL